MSATRSAVARAFVTVTVLLVLSGQLPLIQADPASFTPDPRVQAGFDDLEDHIEAQSSLSTGERNSFLSKLESAETKYNAGQICTAENKMGAFLNQAQGTRANPQRAALAEDLYNRGHSLRASFFDVFVEDPNIAPPACFEPAAFLPPGPTTEASDNTHFAATINFPDATFQTAVGGGETWTQVGMPGLETLIGEPGLPAVPFWRALLAVPQGAQATLEINPPDPVAPVDLNLYPFQESPVDQANEDGSVPDEFADPPFVKDADAYASNAPYPPEPCMLNPVGIYRDVQMVQVICAAGQYDPSTDELTMFDSLSFDVTFDGGSGNFITSQTLSPFEKASNEVISSTLNAPVLASYVSYLDLSSFICFGEELLILTHTNFREAADHLAEWKELKGIETTVINVGSGTAYTTGGAIQDLIHDRYDDCIVRPSYILILGDSEWVPPASIAHDISPDETTGSDWLYASYVQVLFDAFFPDFAVGRMPVDTIGEARIVVNKTIAYESDPPFINLGAGGPFYTTASFASQFQCCRMTQNGNALNAQPGTDQRAFVETSEFVRNTVVGAGKSVERIYTRTTDDGGYCLVNTPPACPSNQIQQPYNGDATPRRYYNGNALPAALAPASGFLWNGDANDVVDAFNDGRFLILHRDHGGPSGWGDPAFNTGHLSSLTNGELLPVIYSVNCASGYWDRETDGEGTSESFMEQILLKSGGGMVGGLGDNRNSPTWPNNALTRGFFDATWPNLAPEYGSGTPITRLGDILNHGKVYLLTQVGVPQTAGSLSMQQLVDEYIMWHVFGDPTLEMWTANPHRLTLPIDFTLAQSGFDFTLAYNVSGAEITAFVPKREGFEAYGRGIVFESQATIRGFNPQPDPPAPESMMLVATFPNSVPVVLQRPQAQPPDLVVRSLTLDGDDNVTQGEDLTSRLHLVIANIDGGPGAGTVLADGSVSGAPGYMVDLVLSSDAAMPNGFASVPQPSGEAFEEDGLLMGGRLSRTLTVPGFGAINYPIGAPVSSDLGGVIPQQAPLATMFLCARVDPGDAVAESNEANNVGCLEVQVFSPPEAVG